MDFFEATARIGAAETLDLETAELLIRVENSGDVLYNELAARLDDCYVFEAPTTTTEPVFGKDYL